MSKWINLLLVLAFSFTYLPSQAQSVDEIVNKYIDAMGGKEKLNSIKSLYMEGVAVGQNGNEINTSVWKADKKLLRSEISFGMGSITMIITDKEGWSSNPRSGGKFEPIPADRVQNAQQELDCAGPLVDYAAKGHKAELIGKEDVEGKPAYRIKLSLANAQELTYFIDAQSYYIIRELRKGGGFGGGGGRPGGGGQGAAGGQQPQGPTELTIDYTDYKKTPDGYTFAYTVTRKGMGGAMTYEKIEVNKPIDEKLYKPSK